MGHHFVHSSCSNHILTCGRFLIQIDCHEDVMGSHNSSYEQSREVGSVLLQTLALGLQFKMFYKARNQPQPGVGALGWVLGLGDVRVC